MRLLRMLRPSSGWRWLVFFGVAYIVVLVAAIKFGFMIPSAGATPSPAASPAPSLVATPSPGVAQTVSNWVGNTDDAFIAFLLALATLGVAIPGAVILFGVALVRLCQMLFREQLVIADIVSQTAKDQTAKGQTAKDASDTKAQTAKGQTAKDASDQTAKDANGQTDWLSQTLREGVSWASTDIQKRYRDKRQAAMPTSTPSADLTAFAEGLKGAAPSPLAALLTSAAALFPPAGIKVECYMASESSPDPRLRLDVKIANLAGGGDVVLESVVSRIAGSKAQDMSNQASDFAGEAGRWLMIRLLRKRHLPHSSDTDDKPANDETRAQWHNKIGVELMWLACSAKALDPEPLYLEAIREFDAAEASQPSLRKNSYQPALNRADAVSYLGILRGSAELQELAKKQYDVALAAAMSAHEGHRTIDRIKQSRLIAQMCTENQADVDEANKVIGEPKNIPHEINVLRAGNKYETLYCRACLYAARGQRAGRRSTANAGYAATYLAHALALQPDLAKWAKIDPDLESIRDAADEIAESADLLHMHERRQVGR